jgi:hypothetical protein
MIQKKFLISEEMSKRIFEGSLDFQKQRIATNVYHEILDFLIEVNQTIDMSKDGTSHEIVFRLDSYNGFVLSLDFVLSNSSANGSFTPPDTITLYLKPLAETETSTYRYRTLHNLFSNSDIRSTFIHEFTHLMDETRANNKIFDLGYLKFYRSLEQLAEESETAYEGFYVEYLDLLKQVERIYKKYKKGGRIKSNIYLPMVEKPNREDYEDEEEFNYVRERYIDSFKIYLFHNAEVNARFHSVVNEIIFSLISGLNDYKKRGDSEELELWAEFFVHKDLKSVMSDFKSKIRRKFNNLLPSPEIMKKLYGRFYVILSKLSKAYKDSGVELFK